MHLIAMQYITKTVATISFAIYSPSYYHFFFHFSTNFGLANPSLVISEVKESTWSVFKPALVVKCAAMVIIG